MRAPGWLASRKGEQCFSIALKEELRKALKCCGNTFKSIKPSKAKLGNVDVRKYQIIKNSPKQSLREQCWLNLVGYIYTIAGSK